MTEADVRRFFEPSGDVATRKLLGTIGMRVSRAR